MLKQAGKLTIACFGIWIILITFGGGMGYGRGQVGFFLQLALGVGLIVAPFTAFAGLLMYFAMVACMVAFPLLGGYIGAEIGGKGSFLIWVGLLAGGVFGFRIVYSDRFFDALKPLLGMVASLDDERPKDVIEQDRTPTGGAGGEKMISSSKKGTASRTPTSKQEQLRLASQAFRDKGSPSYFLDSIDLSIEQKADLYDKALLEVRGYPTRHNPYRRSA